MQGFGAQPRAEPPPDTTTLTYLPSCATVALPVEASVSPLRRAA